MKNNNTFRDDYNIESLKLIKNGYFPMYVTPRYLQHYAKKRHEIFSTEYLINYLKPNTVFVDIGAHYGYYSILASKIHKSIKTISIEPGEVNYQILLKNIKLNNLKNNHSQKLAISNTNGVKIFNINDASDSSGFYSHPLTKTLKKIKVETKKLDTMIGNGKVDFIKIDVEGHEPVALDGMKAVIKNNKNLQMLVEFNPKMYVKTDRDPDLLLRKLHKFNFDLYFIDERKKKYSRWNAKPKSWKKIVVNHTSAVNLLCIKKDKSVFVVFYSHSSLLEGAERSLADLLKQLIAYGVLCHVVIPAPGSFAENLKGHAISFDTVTYSWWAGRQKPDSQTLYNSFINIINYSEYLKLMNPHMVYSNTSVIPWGALSAYLMDIKHMWHIREFIKIGHNMKFYLTNKSTKEIINNFSDRVIFNSKTLYDSYSKFIDKRKSNVVFTNILIDKELLAEKPKTVFNSKSSLKLMIVGSLSEPKGHLQVVNAVKELVDEKKNVELIILGRVDYRIKYVKEVKEYIRKNKMKGHIHFIKFDNNPYAYMQQSDILISCSAGEAFGRTVVEAMMLGKPAIGPDTGATPEVIANGKTGLIYKYNDVSSLKERIEYYYNNRSKARTMGRRAKKLVKKKYNIEGYAGSIYKIMTELKDTKIPSKHNSVERHLLNGLFQKTAKQDKQFNELNEELNIIKYSKYFKAWPTYNKFKKYYKLAISDQNSDK